MNFDKAKECNIYFSDITNHFIKIINGENSNFVFSKEEAKRIEDAFWKELEKNICIELEDYDILRDSYQIIFKDSYNNFFRFFIKGDNFKTSDFVKYSDELQLPFIYKSIDNLATDIFNSINKKKHIAYYDAIKRRVLRELNKEKINYTSPLHSKDPNIFFNFEFIKIQIEELPDDISRLKYLANIQDNYYRLQNTSGIGDSDFQIHPQLISWIWKQEASIQQRFREKEREKGTPFPYETMDGFFHWNDKLYFQIKDYYGEYDFSSIEETINQIQQYFCNSLFVNMDKDIAYMKAQENTLEVAKFVSDKFYKRCELVTSGIIRMKQDQKKVDIIEDTFIQRLEDVKNNDDLDYAEAYRQICNIDFEIKKYKSDYQYGKYDDYRASYDLAKAEELCTILMFRYKELKDTKREKTMKPNNKAKANEKIKANMSIPELACFFRLLNEKGILSNTNVSELCRVIADNFSTKGSDNLTFDYLYNSYNKMDKNILDIWYTKFIELGNLARKEKDKIKDKK